VLLFAGKLVPFKRPLDLAAAAAVTRARGTNVEMMVVGDGELRSKLASAARAASVPLHLLGFYNQTEMPSAYAAADCLVLPSDGRETWGLVANEAAAVRSSYRMPVAAGQILSLTPLWGEDFPLGRWTPCRAR
jgi:glycosyltransferase involved in cell wall biosynthesis